MTSNRMIGPLLVALALPVTVGALSSWATSGDVASWYPTLAKPSFTPPSWLFGPVWTALYLAMGAASFMVWRRGAHRPEVRAALRLYGVQLVLNGAWSLIFFGAHAPGWALVEIVVLLGAVAWTLARFARLRVAAGWVMVPYVAWVGFATLLNGSIWWLNRA